MAEVGGVPTQQVREELERVLASPAFTRSPRRLGRLLSYLCAKALSGEPVKEYSIGVDVMDRPASFDPTDDAIARVEVHRLRKRLREYYEREGKGDKIRIVVPNGQYTPVFEPADKPPVVAPASSRRWLWVACGALLALAIAAAAVLVYRRSAAPVAKPPAEAVQRKVEPAAIATQGIRLVCGQSRPHVDRLSRQWLADQFFEGGAAVEQPRHFIARAFEQRVFDAARAGDFSYHIPLPPGNYELHLYFVETVYGPGAPGGGGEISRMFDVYANERPILTGLDILSDAGDPFVADVRAFKNISPASDGKLHLRFVGRREQARVSAIEIVPAARPGVLNPIRYYFDDGPFTDSSGRLWLPAAHVNGGQTSRHTQPVSGAADAELYSVERFGHFSFAIPVDTGTYALSLHFAEEFVGAGNPSGAGGAGTRVFDVFSNGVALLRGFDIYKEAGINHVLVKTFHGLKPNSQGKLRIDFEPVRDYASLYALEVLEEIR